MAMVDFKLQQHVSLKRQLRQQRPYHSAGHIPRNHFVEAPANQSKCIRSEKIELCCWAVLGVVRPQSSPGDTQALCPSNGRI